MRSSIAVCGALLIALLLGACGGGGDDGPTAEEEVTRAAVRAMESNDGDELCHKLLSKIYIDRVYDGNVAECVRAAEDDDAPGKAKATKPKVNADETKATVTIAISGGSVDGAGGQLEMVKEGTWKVADYDDDLIKSTFIAGIESSDEGLVSTPEMRACFVRQINAMPVAEIRHLTYASSSKEKEKKVEGKLLKMAGECPQSALAEYAAEEFTKGVVNKGNHKPGYVKCIHEELRSLLELTGITAELLGENPDFAAVAALEGITEGAKENCGG